MMGEPIWVLKFIQGCIRPLQFRIVILWLWIDWCQGLNLSIEVNMIPANYIRVWNLQNNPCCYILFTNDKLAQHPFYSYISLFEVIGFKFSINRLIKLIFLEAHILLRCCSIIVNHILYIRTNGVFFSSCVFLQNSWSIRKFEICDKTYLYRFLAIKRYRETQYVYVSCRSENNLKGKSN